MSLDVYLISPEEQEKTGTGVYVRRNGSTVELTLAEVREQFPDATLDEYSWKDRCVYEANVTHNLTNMAEAVSLYYPIWRPGEYLAPDISKAMREELCKPDRSWEIVKSLEESLPTVYARDLIEPLRAGLNLLLSNPERCVKLEAPNGWGTYHQFVPWVEKYLQACQQYPDAEVRVSR